MLRKIQTMIVISAVAALLILAGGCSGKNNGTGTPGQESTTTTLENTSGSP